jgi:hypothetical protein
MICLRKTAQPRRPNSAGETEKWRKVPEFAGGDGGLTVSDEVRAKRKRRRTVADCFSIQQAYATRSPTQYRYRSMENRCLCKVTARP